MFNPSDLLDDHHLQRFSPLPRNAGEGMEPQSHNRDHVQAQTQGHVAQAVHQSLRRDGRKQRYGDIFDMGDGSSGDRIAIRDLDKDNRDVHRDEIQRSNSNGAVNGTTDYSEFDQFLQSNWERMPNARPNTHRHDFQSSNNTIHPQNNYPHAAMFMMGGNMNMNMGNMGMFNAPIPFTMNPIVYQQHQNSLPSYRHEGSGSNAHNTLSASSEKMKKAHAPSSSSDVAAPAVKQKAAKKETKRRRKKPKDCPRRPLSAYNLFFKDERKRILQAIPGESEEMKKKKEEERPEITWPGKKKTPHRKIGFENLAKRIGQAWKDIDPEQLNYYKDLAIQDLQRYADEMKRYEKRLSFRKYYSESDEDDDAQSSRKEKRKGRDINDDSNKRRHENY